MPNQRETFLVEKDGFFGVYERHFKAPDIRHHEMQHEQLLTCYPKAWVQEIVKCCEVTEEKTHDGTKSEEL